MPYDENMISPMREEMTGAGFREARSAEDVDRVFAEEGPMLFFINSVCGCAAGVARPGVLASLNQSILPNNLVTAFAGNDVEAVNRARQLFAGYPPSSPCAAIVRDGRVMHMVERHHIEGQSAENVAQILQSAYDKYCGAEIDESVEIFDPVAALQLMSRWRSSIRWLLCRLPSKRLGSVSAPTGISRCWMYGRPRKSARARSKALSK